MGITITSGQLWSAQKVLIYGTEGIGKTLLAAAFPNPVFSDTEGSTGRYNVKRFDERPRLWDDLLEQARYVRDHAEDFGTYVVDTADWAEALCINHVCKEAGKKNIEGFGYGKGYKILEDEFRKLITILDEVIDVGVNVVIVAHAKINKVDLPDEMGSYDRWELKLTKHVAPVVKEWADMILFLNYKTYVVAADDQGKKFKAQGGQRVMYTTHHTCWDAKNRHGLAEELPLSYDAIQHCIPTAPAKNAGLPFTMDSPKAASAPMQTTGAVIQPTLAGVVYEAERQQQQATTAQDFVEIISEEDVEEFCTYQSGIPAALGKLMRESSVTEKQIRRAVADRGYYPFDTPIGTYDPAFIEDVLISAWSQVLAMIQEQQ